MPELPDVTVYCEAIEKHFVGEPLCRLRVTSPFVLRTFEPSGEEFVGKRLLRTERIGKRICLVFQGDLWCVVHLMIAGRFKLIEAGGTIARKVGLAAWDFSEHSLLLTEAGSKKRASVHLFRSEDAARRLDRGGLDVLEASLEEFAAALRRENRTLKRALSDPRILSGIGNAYSDEILFWAQLSPVKLTGRLSDEEMVRLYVSTRHTLRAWTERLRSEARQHFPIQVTAFRPEMAVHGKYRKPCDQCGTPIQRIVYAHNETNYCPRCQTDGKMLADRALSKLLRRDWPKNIDELEELSASSPGESRLRPERARRPRVGPPALDD